MWCTTIDVHNMCMSLLRWWTKLLVYDKQVHYLFILCKYAHNQTKCCSVDKVVYTHVSFKSFHVLFSYITRKTWQHINSKCIWWFYPTSNMYQYVTTTFHVDILFKRTYSVLLWCYWCMIDFCCDNTCTSTIVYAVFSALLCISWLRERERKRER